MQDVNDFYAYLLDLVAPWKVDAVVMDAVAGGVDVHIGHEERAHIRCRQCHELCFVSGHSAGRVWRHLDTCGKETRLYAKLPLAECTVHGSQEVHAPWEASTSEVSADFEQLVVRLAETWGDHKKVARWVGIEPVLARRIVRQAKEALHQSVHGA